MTRPLVVKAARRCGGLGPVLPSLVTAIFLLMPGAAHAVNSLAVVRDGKPAAVRYVGAPWEKTADGLAAQGRDRWLYADGGLAAGDFHIAARLKLKRLEGTAASFDLSGSRLGFDAGGPKVWTESAGLFLEGPLFAENARPIGDRHGGIEANVFFDFEAIRENGVTRFLIDGREVCRKEEWDEPVGLIGFRSWRSEMTIQNFQISGNLIEPPPPPVYASGQDGYHTYRIPALAVTAKGTVLAFCEGRKAGMSDTGDIDLLVKRSADSGATWSPQRIVWDDGGNTCGNPVPVVDRQTGTIWLLMTWNLGSDYEAQIVAGTNKDTRRVFVTSSDDDGLSWSPPREITAAVKRPDWGWYATGPGGGIRIEHGPHQGRLVIPCNHTEAGRNYAHVFYSDDHGKTWKLGGRTPEPGVNECQVVELPGGRLMLNMRNYHDYTKKVYDSKRERQVSFSDDGGMTWTAPRPDPALIEPICQGAIRRYRWADDEGGSVLLFCNPASRIARVNLSIRASFDEGQTWPVARVVHPGPSGYSDLARLADDRIGCLYEAGDARSFESIRFVSLNERTLATKVRRQ